MHEVFSEDTKSARGCLLIDFYASINKMVQPLHAVKKNSAKISTSYIHLLYSLCFLIWWSFFFFFFYISALKWTFHKLTLFRPKCGLATIQPVILGRAVQVAILASMVSAETYPEVSISWAELCDELLYDLLLGLRLHTQELPPIPSAGAFCLHEVQLTAELGEVGQLIAWLPFSCLAHALAYNTHTHTHNIVHAGYKLNWLHICIH